MLTICFVNYVKFRPEKIKKFDFNNKLIALIINILLTKFLYFKRKFKPKFYFLIQFSLIVF